MLENFLAFDLGGTKLSSGVVNSQGVILEHTRTRVNLEKGKKAVLEQVFLAGKPFLDKYPNIKNVGIASAGPLDPKKGLLLDPTNLLTKGKSWGTVPIASILEKKFKLPVTLENDAAAAILAEKWIGEAKNFKNAMILTLGTGLGTGIICNNKLVRSGSHLHPEAGHIILNPNDKSAPCKCGNLGCAESYLAGSTFTERARKFLKNKNITAIEIVERARQKEKKALMLFDEYSRWLALALYNYTVLFNPEIFIFAGSFAECSDLFLGSAKKQLRTYLTRKKNLYPKKFVHSSLENESGLLGAAYVAARQAQILKRN